MKSALSNVAIPLATQMHPDEWKARIELAACYRVFDLLGWTEMIYNHITVRLPATVAGSEKQFLINPFGLHYSEVTASNLLKIDVLGNKQGDNPYPVNPAGFTVHAAIHQALPDAHCVMHTHTTSGMAVACTQGGLAQNNFYSAQLHDMVAYHDFEGITVHAAIHQALPDAHCVMHTHTTSGMAVACTQGGLAQNNFYSAQLHDMVAYHDFEGITVRAEEAPRLLAAMGDKPLLILRNHGLLASGPTLALTFVRLWTLQRACDIQIAQAALGPAIAVPEALARKTTHDAFQFDAQFGAGQDVFDALVRRVDRIDDSYKR